MKISKSTIILSTLAGFLIGFFVVLIGLINTYFEISNSHKVTLLVLIFTMIVFNIILAFITNLTIKKRREDIKHAYDFYIENMVTASGVGVIIFNSDGEVIWVSKFIDERFSNALIGKKLLSISFEFEKNYLLGKSKFRFTLNGITYEAQTNVANRVIVLKDVTIEETLNRIYSTEKLVIGELEVDNFQQLQSVLPEDELYDVQSTVIKMLDQLVAKYNLIYRQYVNGKFIIITNEQVLDIFKEEDFNFLSTVRNKTVMNGLQLTASIGFGAGSTQQKELVELAKDGLLQAQSRGGDQVAVEYANFKPRYFGATTEIATPSSRVKVKQITAMIEEKLAEKSIKNVIIYGHSQADLDAIGAAFGIYELVKNFNKPVYIQNKTYDQTVDKVIKDMLSKDEREIFIPPTKAQKLSNSGTIAFIVDTAEVSRIENKRALVKVKKENVFVIDHHRASQLPSGIPLENIYIDTSASSASEIVAEMLVFSRYAIKPTKTSVQMMLNGIYLDTKQFQKSVSSRTFEAASWLEKHGAQSQTASEILKIPAASSSFINRIVSDIKEVKEGYFIAAYEGEAPDDVISMAADEILRTQGRKAAFVVAKIPSKKLYKMSARGINTNVQTIAEQVGGGGHFGASAAISSEPLPIFVDNIIQAIVSQKVN